MGAMSAEITKPMPESGSKISANGKVIMASITPMPCPASKTLETIVQARENNKTFGRDIATTESHIADRAELKFGHRRQVKYKATNGQFWPAPGSEDTELGVLMELEVGHGETEVHTGIQA